MDIYSGGPTDDGVGDCDIFRADGFPGGCEVVDARRARVYASAAVRR